MSQFIYGVHPVEEALKHTPDRVKTVMLDKDKKGRLSRLAEFARSVGVQVEWVPSGELDEKAKGGRHQGSACLADDFSYSSIKEYLNRSKPGSRVVVVADHIQDPQNLGNMLRAMGAFGAELLVVGKYRAATITPTVLKTSAGAANLVSVARESSLPKALEELKKAGFWTYGLAGEAETMLAQQELTGDIVLVVGHEGEGLSDLMRKKCDFLCYLPQFGKIQSLNAAMALTAALYERARQQALAAGKPK